MVIAHSLIEELGPRRTGTLLALLEMPDLGLAPRDAEALASFIERVALHYGEDHLVVRQLQAAAPPAADCPEPD